MIYDVIIVICYNDMVVILYDEMVVIWYDYIIDTCYDAPVNLHASIIFCANFRCLSLSSGIDMCP